MKERGSCGGGVWDERANRVGCIVGGGGGDGSREVEERPVRMRAFQAIVRGKVVSEDAHDCFKVPLYIGNESGSGAHRDTKSCMFGRAVLRRERHLYSPERRTEFVQRKTRQKQSFSMLVCFYFYLLPSSSTTYFSAELLAPVPQVCFCATLSVSVKSLSPQRE